MNSKTEMEICPGAHNEEELGSARVELTERAVSVQKLVDQMFY